MKVNIAAQTLSNSAAAAINFLETFKTPGFENSDPTSDFILQINTIFDILNSKSRLDKTTTRPFTLKNIGAINEYVKETEMYLTKLQDLDQGWANYGLRATCGSSNAFLWPAKNLYQARTLPLFSFSRRLIPYKLFINM